MNIYRRLIPVEGFPSFHNVNEKLGDLFDKSNDLVSSNYWRYASKTVTIGKRLLKVAVLNNPDIASRWSKVIDVVIGAWGFFNLISLGQTTFKSVPEAVQKLRDSDVTIDLEGAVFSALSLPVNVMDGLDALGNISTSLNQLVNIPKSPLLSCIGFPVAFGLLSYMSFKEFHSVIHKGLFLYNLEKKLTDDNRENLRTAFHEMDLSDKDKEEIKPLEFKIAQLAGGDKEIGRLKKKITMIEGRQHNRVVQKTDAKVVEIMKKIRGALDKDNLDKNDREMVNRELKNIRTIMKRQVTIGVLNTLANVALTTTLAAASVLSGVFIQSAFTARTSLFLARELYKDFRKTHSGLESEPNDLKG